jgi:hypothetical protein
MGTAGALCDYEKRRCVAETPKDCDYDTAPLGNKLCHYERREHFVDRDMNPVSREANGGQVFITWQKVAEQ